MEGIWSVCVCVCVCVLCRKSDVKAHSLNFVEYIIELNLINAFRMCFVLHIFVERRCVYEQSESVD